MEAREEIEEQRPWRFEGWVALVAGLCWLGFGLGRGILAMGAALVPGCLLVAGGVFAVMVLGGRWVPALVALGGLFGALLSLGVLLFASFGSGLLLFLVSAAAFVAGGGLSLHQLVRVAAAPRPVPSIGLRAQLAIDEALTGQFIATMELPTGPGARNLAAELDAALELFEGRGWFSNPSAYHQEPSAPEQVTSVARQSRGVSFEHASFVSGYEPQAEEPGRERWLAYANNRNSHAWILRHRDESRPWLICLHGYGMGSPLLDLGAFDPGFLHDRLGLNLLVPTLPLHGRRAAGRRSGRGFLEQPLNTVHSMANMIWDLKRWRLWMNERGAERVGIYGLSMGGYTTALAASLLDDFECAISSIPVSDWSRILWYHLPEQVRLELTHYGVSRDKLETLYRPVSPLAFEPRVPVNRRTIFGGVADRIVPPSHAQALIEHWNPGRVEWYQGGHISTVAKKPYAAALAEALSEAGLARSQHVERAA